MFASVRSIGGVVCVICIVFENVWYCMLLYGTVCCCMVLYSIVWYCMVLYGAV